MQPGVKLDFRNFNDGYVVTADDVAAELERIGHDLQPLDIVMVNTRAGSAYGHDDYVDAGCGMGYDATMYLLERGVRLTGTDAWSWDAPFTYTAERYAESGDASIIWEGHKAGRDIGYCHLEKLHNLEALPGDGFTVCEAMAGSQPPPGPGGGEEPVEGAGRPAGGRPCPCRSPKGNPGGVPARLQRNRRGQFWPPIAPSRGSISKAD